MELNQIKRGSAYSFSSFASRIWPSITGAMCDTTNAGFATASSFANVAAQHAAALAYLPAGTPTDPTKLNYLIFVINGTQVVYAWEWINPTTVVETQTGMRTVTLVGATAADDLRIREAMAAAGFTISSIT